MLVLTEPLQLPALQPVLVAPPRCVAAWMLAAHRLLMLAPLGTHQRQTTPETPAESGSSTAKKRTKEQVLGELLISFSRLLYSAPPADFEIHKDVGRVVAGRGDIMQMWEGNIHADVGRVVQGNTGKIGNIHADVGRVVAVNKQTGRQEE
jgi:hypothetical protein